VLARRPPTVHADESEVESGSEPGSGSELPA
jgi:hypothetical protein